MEYSVAPLGATSQYLLVVCAMNARCHYDVLNIAVVALASVAVDAAAAEMVGMAWSSGGN